MYYLKYYAEIQNFRGQFSRVEIHQAGTRPGQVLIIGDVCGLDLEIQGSQDDVFSPIVKTQAHLSMISSDDKPTSGGVKYGGWGEFFTPDATLYKMLIKTRATEQDPWTTRWTGYITPDSWQEDLGYRTPVTITARDNIGHLQDFEFDFDNYDQYGLASIRSIITAGMNLIELPMTLDMNSAPANFQADGTSVLDAMVMCRHFEGKDWYSVIESLLDAIGYTLRYTDNNRVTLAPIRYLPNGGRGTGGDNRSNAVPVQFYDGNGVVVPAVKSIIEDHNYDYLGEVEIPIKSSDINYGPEGSYKAYVKWTNTRPGMEGKDSPVYSIVDGGSTNWLPGSDLYKTDDPSLLTLDREGESWDDYIFLAANGKRYTDAEGKRKQALQFSTRTPNVTLRAKFNSNPLSELQDITVPEDPEYEEEIKGGFVLENIGLYTFEFKIKYESNGETIYWDDTAGWVTEEVTNTRTFEPSSMTTDVEIQLESAYGMDGHGVMTFYFENIQYETSGISSLIVACHGVYARLSSFTVEPNAINLSKNTVKTNSDERYNVILRRNPEVSPLSRDVLFALPENYETGLFYYPSGSNFPEQYPYSGNWSNLNTSATKPLPVIIHQQILAFRGGVLWELSGECAPIDGGILFANQLVRYKDRVYLITSGTIDFYGSGNLLSAVLREYVDYDDIWDDTEQGDWSGDGEYNTIGGETASGSGHSGSSGGGGGSATNFFELDGEGGVKLKDRYNGLWTNGFMTAGGSRASGSGGGGGADLTDVWLSLKTNEDAFANEKINAAHLPLGSGLTINQLGLIDVSINVGVTSVAGLTGAVSTSDLQSALGLGSLAYKSSLQASDIPMLTTAKISDIGAAATYGIGSVTSGNNGLVTGGAVYAAINSAISAAIKYQGITTTELTDGATTNPIVIDGDSYTAVRGDEVIYGGREYLFTGSKWQQLGDEESWANKTVSITGTGYLSGGGTLEANRTIDIASNVKTSIDNGATAYSWGNHANAGYFAASSFTAANIVSTLGTTAVNRAIADADGNNIASTYATITALNNVSNRVSTLEGRTNWDNYFGIDASGNIYVKMKDANTARNFYSYGAVTAGGVGSSSGGGGGEGASLLAVWRSLTNNNSLVDADITSTLKIATAHIPDLSISKVTGLQTALDGKQATISDLSTIRSNASLGASAYNALPNYIPWSSESSLSVASAVQATKSTYLLSPYSYNGNNTITDSTTSASIKVNGEGGCAVVAFHTTDWGWSDTLYWTGYGQWGGTELATQYNAGANVRVKIRKFWQDTMGWGDWTEFITSGNIASQSVSYATTAGSIDHANHGVIISEGPSTWPYRNILSTGWNNTVQDYTDIGTAGDNNNTEVLRIIANGSVGIGTTSPAYKLDVNGTFRASGAAYFSGNITLQGSMFADRFRTNGSNSDSGLWKGSSWTSSLGDNDIAIGTNGANGTIALLANYVGIRSVIPACALDVAGTTRAYGLKIAGGNNYVVDGTGLELFWDGNRGCIQCYGRGTTSASAPMYFYASSYYFDSGNIQATGSLTVGGSVSISGDIVSSGSLITGAFYSGTDSGGVYFEGRSSSGLRIQYDKGSGVYDILKLSGGVATFNSNVIWHAGNSNLTTVAWSASSLTLAGAISGATSISASGVTKSGGFKIDADGGTQVSSGTGLDVFWENNAVCFVSYGRDTTGTFYPIKFIASKFYFDNNVGIGVANPSYKLDVSGTFNATGNSTIGGTLSVTGATTLSGALTVNNTASVSGNASFGGTITVSGAAYLDSTVRIGGSSGATFTYVSANSGLNINTGLYSDSYITAGGVNASSDARLKDNISRVSGADAIAVIMALKPSEWVWNEKHYQNGQKGAGLIAQDVQCVLPFAVGHETEYLSLNHNVFDAYEIAALQKHETELQAMKRKLANAERKIEHLERELAEVRAN